MSKMSIRINQLAKSKNMDPNRLKALFALERIVARLERSRKLSKSLIYKGGFVLVKTIDTDRFTRDIDALAHSISEEQAISLILDAVADNLNDGIAFGDPHVSEIETTGDYGGIRVDWCFQLDSISISPNFFKKLPRVHLDVGFGPKIPSVISASKMTSITEDMDFELYWTIYPLEFIFAEKLETLVSRGSANSRAKDVYDMWKISKKEMDTKKLISAIKTTFFHRRTDLPQNLLSYVNALDTLLLKTAWRSVLFKEKHLDFDQTFKELTLFLEKIDFSE